MADSYRFPSVEHFTAGTVGPKGQRVFYLQFGTTGDLVALRLEKQQVMALAEYLEELLEQLETPTYDAVPLALDLIEPVQPRFIVASLGAAFQTETDRFVVFAEELLEEGSEQEPSSAQMQLTRGQVAAFIQRAKQVVSAGRPPCAFCGRPLDHDDTWCPCWN